MSERINAERFARMSPNGFAFGLDSASAAAELRRIAGMLEAAEPARQILLRSVKVIQIAQMDDFHVARIIIEVVERAPTGVEEAERVLNEGSRP